MLLECYEDQLNYGKTYSVHPLHAGSPQWRVMIKAPANSPYTDGVFELLIVLPEKFPDEAPQVYVITKIHHMNIGSRNQVMRKGDHLASWWKPTMTIRSLIFEIMRELGKFYPDEAMMIPGVGNAQQAIAYQRNSFEYEQVARDFTLRFARQEEPKMSDDYEEFKEPDS
jgi:ubiquitin-protein ligase